MEKFRLKPKEEKKVVAIYLPISVREAIQRRADRNNRSFSREVATILSRAVGKEEKE